MAHQLGWIIPSILVGLTLYGIWAEHFQGRSFFAALDHMRGEEYQEPEESERRPRRRPGVYDQEEEEEDW